MEQDTVKVVKRTIGLVLILAAAMGIAGILLEIFGSPWGASGAQKAAIRVFYTRALRLFLTAHVVEHHFHHTK